MGGELSNKIIKNSTYNVIRGAVNFLILLFLTPFMIFKLGKIGFGVWTMVGVFSSYVSLADLSISSALVKYVAEYEAKKDREKINELFNTSFIVYLILGGVIALIIILIKSWIIALFFKVEGIYQEINFVLVGSVLIFVVNLVFSVYASLLNGFQRMDLTNKINIVAAVIQGIGTIIVLNLGLGLYGLIYLGAGVIFVSILLNILAIRRYYPQIHLNLHSFNLTEMKKLFKFSLPIQTSALASFFHYQIDKLLLSFFLGVSYVTYYEAASRIALFLRKFPENIIGPILPAASELFALQDHKMLTDLFYRSLKYIILLSIPLFIFAIVFASKIIEFWLGEGWELSVLTLQILSAAFLINILTGPGFHILNGMGKPLYGMQSSILAAVLNLILSLLLISNYGYAGVVIGTFISMLAAAVYFFYLFGQASGISFFNSLREALFLPLMVSVFISILCYFILLFSLQNAFGFIIVIFGYMILYFIVLNLTGFIDEFDKKLAVKYFPFLKKVLR